MKTLTWTVLLILAADTVYSHLYGLNYHTRDKCIIYQFLPRWLFLINEHFFELFMAVTAGVFAGVLAEKYFSRFGKLYPSNQISAFLYASLIPVCSCSAVPLIESMKSRLPMRTVITFVAAAPLLNPYILFMSFSILGVRYAVLRTAGAFLVSVITGLTVELIYNLSGRPQTGTRISCPSENCAEKTEQDVYVKTWKLVGRIMPFILIAGVAGLLLELTGPLKILERMPLNGSFISLAVVTVVGMAVYMCNGADIVFLAPLLMYTGLDLGNAIAFSLSSTAVCLSSIVMLLKFLGRRLTVTMAVSVFLVIIGYSSCIKIFL